jgi:hypothetical protein
MLYLHPDNPSDESLQLLESLVQLSGFFFIQSGLRSSIDYRGLLTEPVPPSAEVSRFRLLQVFSRSSSIPCVISCLSWAGNMPNVLEIGFVCEDFRIQQPNTTSFPVGSCSRECFRGNRLSLMPTCFYLTERVWTVSRYTSDTSPMSCRDCYDLSWA